MQHLLSDDVNFWPLVDNFLSTHDKSPALYSPLHRDYYQEYSQLGYKPLSIAFMIKGQIIAVLPLTLSKCDNRLGFYGFPCQLFIAPALASAQVREVQAHALDYLLDAAKLYSASTLYRPAQNHSPDLIALRLLELGANIHSSFQHSISLQHDEKMLLSSMRKSWRKSIRWGESNMSMEVVNAESGNQQQAIDAFRELHYRESKRQTRSALTWDIQKQMLAEKQSFLVMGYLGSELVAASLFAYYAHRAYYSSAAYRRDLFPSPISHFPVWLGILEAKRIGCQWLDMGELYYPNLKMLNGQTPTHKECSISHFKRGFGGEFLLSVDYLLS